MKLSLIRCLTLFVAVSSLARAAVRTEVVEYRDGDTVLEGYVAWDDAVKAPRPGVLVVHQWKGLTDYEKKRAAMLAELGYVAFCADIYGKGVRPPTPAEAGPLAGKYKADRALLRRRVNVALAQLRARSEVAGRPLAAIGYCFGGTTALELARSGADVAGVVSFHGGLATPTPADAKNIRGRVLALHGADDPFVPAAEVAGFEQEMRDAKVDWQLVAYGGAVHSFTHWGEDGSFNAGSKYNAAADRRSWEAMKSFFAEVLR
jgi:dienelactone hydrolase